MKFCLKCYDYDYSTGSQFCSSCGTKMIEWNLTCECGEEIRPIFIDYRPLWIRTPLHKHCPKCGRRTDKILKQEVRRLKSTTT